MSTTSIRIERKTHERLQELAKVEHRSMAKIVSDAIARYEEETFWRKAREGYERLNADPQDRAEFDAEISHWDITLQDGLKDFPYNEPDDE